MVSRKVDIFGSSSELKRLENEEEITFKEYKYRCYYGVKAYRVGDVIWDVCIWLTSFPSELQEMRDFRNDSTFSTYSMDIITLEKSDRIKAVVRRTGNDGFFSLEGKHLNEVLVLISESEHNAKKQEAGTTEQTASTEPEDRRHDSGASSSSTEHNQDDPSVTLRQNESAVPQVGDTSSKQTILTPNGISLSTAEKQHKDPSLIAGNVQEVGQTTASQLKPCSYKMESRPRGVCMIINNEDFHSLTDSTVLEKRHGAQQDVDKLSTLFTRLLFKVVVYKNLRDNQVVMAAKHMSLADHSEYDCFVCCILSHGTQGSIYGVNHVAVPVSEVLSQFRSRACHTLAGKPKLFFIQACQGLEPQLGVAVTDTPSLPHPAKLAADGTDFLVAYSTEPGYVAFRHREAGSYFIDALVRNLQGLPDFSLHDVMAKVCDDVSQLNINDGFKQVPQFTSTLTRQLVLCRASPAGQTDWCNVDDVTSTVHKNNHITPTTPTHGYNDVTSDIRKTSAKGKSHICVIS